MLVNSEVRSRTFTLICFNFGCYPLCPKWKCIWFNSLLFSCEIAGRAKISFKQNVGFFDFSCFGLFGVFKICFVCKIWMNKESLSERETWILIEQVWCSLLIQATKVWGFLVIKLGSKANVCKTIVKHFKAFFFLFLKGTHVGHTLQIWKWEVVSWVRWTTHPPMESMDTYQGMHLQQADCLVSETQICFVLYCL